MNRSRISIHALKRYLTYKESTIAYRQFGIGSRPLICFHGYGESGDSYNFLENYLALSEYTVIAIDLPFHGDTDWKNDLNFSTEDLFKIVTELISSLQLDPNNCIVLGFSLGGRMCLTLYETMPDKITKMILLAPDGLKLNFWYWLSTQTAIGRGLFRFTMKNPGWFFGLLNILNSLRLVNSSIHKFVRYYIHDERVREELYQRWISLRRLKPHIGQIKTMIRKNKTSVKLVYGNHDRIILPVRGEKFCSKLDDLCSLRIIESGHQVLHEKHAEEIVQAIID